MVQTSTFVYRAALLTGRYQTRSGIYPDVLGITSKGGELVGTLSVIVCVHNVK